MITCKSSKGTTYYLKIGTTKNGKVRYFVSTDPYKLQNAPVMPKGYEFRENVNGQVSVGKIQPRYIDEAEFGVIKPFLDQLEVAFQAEVKGKSIIIHTSHIGEGLEDSPFFSTRREAREWIRETAAVYQPMLKFTLCDPEKRHYRTERKCFMSGMSCLLIGDIAPLEPLARKYIPLLDDEDALFEEIYLTRHSHDPLHLPRAVSGF